MFDVPSLAQFLEEANLAVTLPALSLLLGTCVLLLADLWIPKDRKDITAKLAVAGLAVSFVLNLIYYNPENPVAFGGMFVADAFTGFLNVVILLTAFVSVLLSLDYVKRTGIERGEFYSLLLLSTAGMMFMVSATDLIVVFIALELLSIPLYILSAFRAPDVKSEESGLKYFILGAFASAFFVYGAALVYGATGTTNLREIFAAISPILASESATAPFLLLVGGSLLFVGLGFKVAVVPFHMWTPDVYEGAPTPVTAFMSVGAKIGGFAALLRIFAVALPTLIIGNNADAAAWQQTLWIIAAATLILGNVVAIAQRNIKRLLAYSSISHAGYILMAVAAAGTAGVGEIAIRGALVYLLAYMFTNLGAFAIAIAVEKDDGSGTDLEDFVGLSRTRPALALAMAFFMLSLIGIPLTGGFIGKLLVFQASLEAGLLPLVIIAIITSVISAFYYARVIVNMYLREGEGAEAPAVSSYLNWAIYAMAAGTFILGVFPPLVTNLTDMVTLVAMLP